MLIGPHVSYTLVIKNAPHLLHSVYTFDYTFDTLWATLFLHFVYTFPTLCLHFFPMLFLHFCSHFWYTLGYTSLHLPYTLSTLFPHFANQKCATFATLSYTLSTHLSTLFVHSRPHFPALSLHFVYTLIQDIRVASWIDIRDNIA
jgi:hypothetical protein